MIFVWGWLRLAVALGITIASSVAIWIFLKKTANNGPRIDWRKSTIAWAIIAFIVILVWCYFSGLGGFTMQTYDWQKHNVLLRDLIDRPWPVRYDFNGEGVMSYYIGEYMVPAVLGKIGGFDVAQIAMMFWVAGGMMITCLYLYALMGKDKGRNFILILFGIIMFSTFITPISGIYRKWFPEDFADGTHWLSRGVMVQLSSNIISMRWVFAQFVPTALAVAMIMKKEHSTKYWLIILAPLALYSTFTFIGLAGIMSFKLVIDMIKTKKFKPFIKEVVALTNLLMLPMIVVFVMYLLGNMTQHKPESIKMAFGLIDYTNHRWTLVALQLMWGFWLLLLYRKEKRNSTLWAAAISLFLFPFFTMGRYNDLCMRGSIPALLVFCYLVIDNMIKGFRKDRFYAWLLACCLIIAGCGSLTEFKIGISETKFGERNYNDPFKTSRDFYFSEPHILYQYVSWKPNSILLRTILKK